MSKQTPPRMGCIDIKETGENGMKIWFLRRNPLGRRDLVGRRGTSKNTPTEVLNGVSLVDNLTFNLKLKWVNVNQSLTQKSLLNWKFGDIKSLKGSGRGDTRCH